MKEIVDGELARPDVARNVLHHAGGSIEGLVGLPNHQAAQLVRRSPVHNDHGRPIQLPRDPKRDAGNRISVPRLQLQGIRPSSIKLNRVPPRARQEKQKHRKPGFDREFHDLVGSEMKPLYGIRAFEH
jgi:hypothetical protein